MARCLKFLAIFSCIFLYTNLASAGVKIKVVSGDLGFLKQQKNLLVEYDYSNMTVKKSSEKEYVDKKVKEYNEEEPGKGDKWKEAWVSDREKRFQPKFETMFNEVAGTKVKVSPDASDAKYKVIVHTVFTEPGFNVAITKKPAIINLEISFVEIANPNKPVAMVTLEKAPGKTFGLGDIDTGVRISEAYEKAGKELGQYIMKEVFD